MRPRASAMIVIDLEFYLQVVGSLLFRLLGEHEEKTTINNKTHTHERMTNRKKVIVSHFSSTSPPCED